MSSSSKRVLSFKASRLIRLFDHPNSPAKMPAGAKSSKAGGGPKGAAQPSGTEKDQEVDKAAVEQSSKETGTKSKTPTLQDRVRRNSEGGAAGSINKDQDIRSFLVPASGIATPQRQKRGQEGVITPEDAGGKRTDRRQQEERGMSQEEDREVEEVLMEGENGEDDIGIIGAGSPVNLMPVEMKNQWAHGLADLLNGAGVKVPGLLEALMRVNETMTYKVINEWGKPLVRRAIGQELAKDRELEKVRRSVLLHNVDLWLKGEKDTEGHWVADRVTAAIHRLTKGMVTVVEAFPLGRGTGGKEATSVLVTFGSARQKGCWFRCLASAMKAGGRSGDLQRLSCRDAFPKEDVEDARQLVREGMALKHEGRAVTFRVKATGPGCLPVLEVKRRSVDGRLTEWLVAERQDEGMASEGVGQRREQEANRWNEVSSRGRNRTTRRADGSEVSREEAMRRAMGDEQMDKMIEEERERLLKQLKDLEKREKVQEDIQAWSKRSMQRLRDRQSGIPRGLEQYQRGEVTPSP